jgi:hypothetical protein
MSDQDAPKPDSEPQNDANPSAEKKDDTSPKDNAATDSPAPKDAEKPDTKPETTSDEKKSDSKKSEDKPAKGKKKSGIVKKLGIVAGVLFVLAFIGYFVATSAFFIKAFVMPKVGKILNAEIKLANASISPFSEVTLEGVEVTANGEELLASVGSVKARYSLMDILGGNINVFEITIDSPTLHLLVKKDGTTNLDPILQALATDEAPPPPGETPQVSIKNVSLKNATVNVVRELPEGGTQTVVVKNVNLTLDLLGNGQPSKIDIAAALGVELPGAAGKLGADIKASYLIELNADLFPQKISGKTMIGVSEATGELALAKGFGTEIEVTLTPTDLSETMRFLQDGKQLGQIKLSGPFNSQDLSADLKFVVDPIDKKALNIAGAMIGMDFATTVISSESQIKITAGAQQISVTGNLKMDKLAVSQIVDGKKGRTTPVLDISVGYGTDVDLAGMSATISKLSLNGSNAKGPFLAGNLNKPVTVSFGDAVKTTGNAAYTLKVTDFDLTSLRSFAGDSVPEGALNLNLDVTADSTGENVGVNYDAKLNQNGQPVLDASGDVAVVLATMAIDLTSTVSAELSKLSIDGQPLVPAEQNASMKLAMNSSLSGSTFTLKEFKSTFNEDAKEITSIGGAAVITLPSDKDKSIRIANAKIQLAPTARAQNTLTLNGSLIPADLISGKFDIKSDGIDITPFMDLFMPEEAPSTEPAPTQEPAPAPAPSSDEEPPAIDLPIETFDLDIAITKFFAREIAISNYVTKVAIKRSQVNVDPVSLTFNGAPINAKALLNLGVPGYEYDVALKIDRLQIKPLVDSFVPEYKNKVAGELLTDIGIKGKGITGANLQKHLNGHVQTTLTNAVANVLEKGIIMKTVAAILQAPEIMEPPLDYLNTSIQIGHGMANIENFILQSASFQATAKGTVTIDQVLTNSALNIPVGIALSKNLIRNFKVSGGDPNAKYTPLPEFVTIKGTVGAHETEIKKGKLLALAAQAGFAAPKNLVDGAIGAAAGLGAKADDTISKLTGGTVDKLTGGAVGGLFNKLVGKKPASTNSTDKAGTTTTNKAPGLKLPFNPFNPFKRK